MSRQQLLDLALEALRDRGAEGDAFFEHRRELSVRVRDDQIESIARAEVRGLAVRAMKDGKLGFAHTAQADPDGAAGAARTACELAGAASPREELLLAGPSGPGDGRDEGKALDLHDDSIDSHELDEKVERARRAESAARAFDPRIRRTESATYQETLASYWIANTNGLYRHFRKSRVQVGIEVTAEEGDQKQPGTRSAAAVRWADLPDPEKLGREAAERGLRLLGGRAVPTGRYPVVFSPDVGWSLLVYLANALNGDALAKGRSWLAGRAGSSIGSQMVTIRDEGRRRAGLASAPFDGEGVDTGENVLVDAGLLRGQILDLAAAKRLGLRSTGNAARGGYEGLPGIAPRNLYLAPGLATPDEIIAPIEKGLWVWGLSGWWIGLDPSNPTFSSGVSGVWIENGKVVRAVAQSTVAGAIEEILNNIDAVAGDLEWTDDTRTPTFRVREMTVSGT